MESLRKNIENDLNELMLGAENFFGAENPKRAGHIRCALDRIMPKIEGAAAAPQGMDTAPRDGTHILAYLYREGDDEQADFGEWREVFYKPYRSFGMDMPWHAGDPADSHSGGPAPEHYGDGIPKAWLPLPRRRSLAEAIDIARGGSAPPAAKRGFA